MNLALHRFRKSIMSGTLPGPNSSRGRARKQGHSGPGTIPGIPFAERFLILIIFVVLVLPVASTVARSLEEYSSKTNAMINSGQWVELEKLMREGIREYPDREWMHATLNQALRNQNRTEEAIEQARSMRQKWPGSERSTNTLSWALTGGASEAYRQDRFEECLNLATEANELNQSESSFVWMGNALRRLERFQEAVEIQRRGLQKFPSNPWLGPNLAATYAAWGQQKEQSGALEQSADLYEKAYSLDPEQEYILFLLARARREQGRFDESIRLFEEGTRRFPESQNMRRGLSYTHLVRLRAGLNTATEGEIRAMAEEALKQARKQKKYEDAEHYIKTVGEAYTSLKDEASLRKDLLSLERTLSDSIPLWDYYGWQFYVLHRRQGPVSEEAKKESLAFRRKAMNAYEQKHPNRPVIRNLPLPLKNPFMVWAEFDGDYMTHTGFAKYCYDFARVENGSPLRPGGKRFIAEDYLMFGEPVYSVTSGEVNMVKEDAPDNSGGDYGYEGNSVVIKTQEGHFVFYTHLKQDSVRVEEGQKVGDGTLLGLAGNSGMSSEPHLHFCIYDSNWVSLPFYFKKIQVQKGDERELTGEPLKQGWIVYPQD